MKKPVVKQIKEVTAEFQPEVLVLEERENVPFSCKTKVHVTCQQFGKVYVSPVSPGNCYATGRGLEVARVGVECNVERIPVLPLYQFILIVFGSCMCKQRAV